MNGKVYLQTQTDYYSTPQGREKYLLSPWVAPEAIEVGSLQEPGDHKISLLTIPSALAIPCWLLVLSGVEALGIETRNYPFPDSYRPVAPMGHRLFCKHSSKAITFSIQLPCWLFYIEPQYNLSPDKTFSIQLPCWLLVLSGVEVLVIETEPHQSPDKTFLIRHS